MERGVHYIGIDLAWGERQRTGLAVLDAEGRLVHVSSVRTDEEIREALAAYVDGPCRVGIDAPLIVTNPTGSRVAEEELNRDFRGFEAGAHPSNTGKPEFADGTRGARLCKLLRLDMDPASGRQRRAIEVYPHPATVVLFGLTRTLKYKNKPGRTLDTLRAALLTLMDHVERVVPADAAWRALRADGRGRHAQERPGSGRGPGGRRGVRLRRPVRRPVARPGHDVRRLRARLHRHADPATRRPRGRDPARPSRSTPSGSRPGRAADEFVGRVTSLLDEAGVNYLSVTGRAKTVGSFAAKAARTVDGLPAYATRCARSPTRSGSG